MVSLKFKNITPSSTVSLNNIYNAMKKNGESAISFAAGEPDPTTPADVMDFAFEKAREGNTHYTPSAGIQELRERIARKYEKIALKEVRASNVIVTIAKFAIHSAVESVIESGDEVLLQDPSFVSYPEIIKLAGGIPRYFSSLEDGSPDIESLKNNISGRTRMIIINSPSNPQGWVANVSELKEISDIVIDKKLYVVSDEIYEKIIFEGRHESILRFPGMEDRTFVVNGFSKSHAMTGWRIGYLIAPPEFAPYIDSFQQHTITCASSVSQFAALRALDDDDFPTHMNIMFRERRDLLYDLLKENEVFKLNKPKGTFYMFPELVNGLDGEEFSKELLEKERVLVTPGSQFGPSGSNRIRLSFAISRDQIMEGAGRIAHFLRN